LAEEVVEPCTPNVCDGNRATARGENCGADTAK